MVWRLAFVLDDDGLACRDGDERRVSHPLEVDLHLDPGKVGGNTVLADGERTRRVMVVEDSAEFEDLDCLRARVRYGGGDLDVSDRVNVRRCYESGGSLSRRRAERRARTS